MMTLNLKCNLLENPLQVSGNRILLTFVKGEYEFNEFCICMASSLEGMENRRYDVLYQRYSGNGRVYVTLPENVKGRVYWRVEALYDVSEVAFFEVGNGLEGAKWIAPSAIENGGIYIFEKEFHLPSKPMQARLNVCGLGFYDGKINAKRVDGYYFKPNFTDYKKRTEPALTEGNDYFAVYNTYDVTELLCKGQNTMRFRVAGGFYNNTDKRDAPNWKYGDERLIFALTAQCEDGTHTIVSDESCLSAVLKTKSTLFLGDRVDFTESMPVLERSKVLAQDIRLLPAQCTDDKLERVFFPHPLTQEEKRKVYDFGLNHTGGISCLVKGERGTVLTVRYAEVMTDGELNFDTSAYEDFVDETEHFDLGNPHKAKKKVIQENTYILSGNEDEIVPLFSWRCYRYIEMTADRPFQVEGLVSQFICSDIKRTGSFYCSEEIFNDLFEMYIQTQQCNMHSGVITDCPHREKLPYTGDGRLVAKSFLYNFDGEVLLRKWLKDILAAQGEDGYVPHSAPDMSVGGGYFWGFSVVDIPIKLYEFTGDMYYLKKAYASMRKWCEYLNARHEGDYIVGGNGRKWLLSDWLPPEEVKIDCRYFSTVCFYLSVVKTQWVHERLYGNKDAELETWAEKIKAAVNQTFYNAEKGVYAGNVQGESVLALLAGIPEAQEIEKIKKSVYHYYKHEKRSHFDTGIIMTPFLLEYLTTNGMEDLALSMMTQKDYPSFYMLMQGETTLPEHWSKKWINYSWADGGIETLGGDDVSHCHPMFGSVVEWLFECVGGLNFSKLYQNVVQFSPMYVDKIDYASVSANTMNGVAKCEYSMQNGFEMFVSVPNGLQGEVCVKDLRGSFSVTGERSFNTSCEDGLCLSLPGGTWKIKKV